MVHHLKTTYPDVPITLGGDKNDLLVEPILTGWSSCRQIVDFPTHKDGHLDIILTDLYKCYQKPTSQEAVPCDNPTSGKPSDHLSIWAFPKTMLTQESTARYRIISTRNFNQGQKLNRNG